MNACHGDRKSLPKTPPATRSSASNLQDAILTQLGTGATYFIVWRPSDNDASPNGYVSNQRDPRRLAEWLRHMADGIERNAP